jgi:hypothetical protein
LEPVKANVVSLVFGPQGRWQSVLEAMTLDSRTCRIHDIMRLKIIVDELNKRAGESDLVALLRASRQARRKQ